MNERPYPRSLPRDPARRLPLRLLLAVFALAAGTAGLRAQTAQDLVAWAEVDRWQGHYECRRTAERNNVNGPYRWITHQEATASLDFVLERIPGKKGFRVTQSRVSGSVTASSWEGDSADHYHNYSEAGAFSGSVTATDVGIAINQGPAKPGHWMLWVGGKLAQKFSIGQTWHDSRWVDHEEVRDGQETRESDDYPHASFTGALPSGPP